MRRAADAMVTMHEDGASSPSSVRSPSKRDRDDDEDGVAPPAQRWGGGWGGFKAGFLLR